MSQCVVHVFEQVDIDHHQHANTVGCGCRDRRFDGLFRRRLVQKSGHGIDAGFIEQLQLLFLLPVDVADNAQSLDWLTFFPVYLHAVQGKPFVFIADGIHT